MMQESGRPKGGTGRDLIVCDRCNKKVVFYYEVGDMEMHDTACPECGAEVKLQGFRSWEEDQSG